MTVLFLTKYFYPHIGGVERHVLKLSQALVKAGIRVIVVTNQHEKSLVLNDLYKGIRVVRMPREIMDKKYYTWQWLSNQKSLFAEADVVHVHDVFWWLYPQLLKSHPPRFMTFHGWEGTFPPSMKAKIARKIAQKATFANICVGDFIQTWYGTKPNLVTYGATDQKALEAGDKKRVLVLGRLSLDNDIYLVLRSLEKLKEKRPDIKITFLGDGEAAWEAEKIGRVLGFQQEIDDHLHMPRWVIASSYLSIMDAMASGRYVFAFHTNPLKKEYLAKHPMAEHFSLASSVDMFLHEFELHYRNTEATNVRIARTQSWALEQTWDRLAKEYISLWKQHHKIAMGQFASELSSPK